MIKKLVLMLMFLAPIAVAQKVVLKWTNPATNPSCGPISAVNIYRSDTLGGEIIGTASLPGNKIATLAPGTTTYTDATVTFGQTKYYKATEWAAAPCSAESVFSNEAIVVIPVQVIIISPPTGLTSSVVIP